MEENIGRFRHIKVRQFKMSRKCITTITQIMDEINLTGEKLSLNTYDSWNQCGMM